jgi:hypothetical protein
MDEALSLFKGGSGTDSVGESDETSSALTSESSFDFLPAFFEAFSLRLNSCHDEMTAIDFVHQRMSRLI